ncbi:MAG: serine/threonine protein kinase [Myxococcales bacterium]|nr:serine/threonine protein kinase [Myxococcales bacterium]
MARRGTTLGRYLVLGELGSGAMGRVLKAYDETLDRTVALKLLHREAAEQNAERLRREAQALAKLSHPNVVQVYEVRCDRRQWFIAMELVGGQTLREWQEHDRRWRECVAVYLQVGAGLAAAHAVGLVHRDFKPDNCIIDEDGRARILDFGLVGGQPLHGADDEDDPRWSLPKGDLTLTAPGVVMGTPAYMPLEQMDGRGVDARGDQFSFCVSLYEALFGKRPFEGRTFEALRESVFLEMIAAAPKGTRVPARLRGILLRGLSADPEHRWPSMPDLIARLRTFVAPRARRRLVIGLAGGLAVAGVGLARYAEVGFRCEGARERLDGVWDEERRAEVRAAIVGTGLIHAPDVWERVVGPGLDSYASAWVEQHTDACEAARVRQEQSTEVMDLRMGCLHHAKVALDAAVEVLGGADADVVTNAHELVGSLPDLGQCADVETLLDDVAPPRSEDAGAVEDARGALASARAEREAGRYELARARLEEGARVLAAVEYDPVRAELALEEGWLSSVVGDYGASQVSARRALALASRHRQPRRMQEAAHALMFVIGCEEYRAEQALAYREVVEELARSEPLLEIGAASTIACVLHTQGKLDEAIDYHRLAIEEAESIGMRGGPRVATLYNNLGATLLMRGRLDEAEHAHRTALELVRRSLGPHHPHIARSLNNVANVEIAQHRLEEAELDLRQSLAIRLRAFGPEHPDVGESREALGVALWAQERYTEAEVEHRRSLEILEAAFGPYHPHVAGSHNNLANALYGQRRLLESEAEHRKALEIRVRVLEPEHPDIAVSMSNIATAMGTQGRLAEAEAMHRQGIELFERVMGPDHPHLSIMRGALADVLRAKGELPAED